MPNEKNIDQQTEKELQKQYYELLNHVKEEITPPPQDQTRMFYAGHKDYCSEFIDQMNKRIDDHVKYIKKLLYVHGEKETEIKVVEFHYRTVAHHFIGHTLEDVAEMADQHGAIEVAKKCRRILEEMRR